MLKDSYMLFENFKIIDLTQALCEGIPTWSGSCGYCLKIKSDYDHKFKVNELEMAAGIGTHIDAPSHLIKGGLGIDQLNLAQLIAPACIIDISQKAKPDYELTIDDIKTYENSYGLIAKGSVVIANTGWNRFWNDAKAYRNQDVQGKMHFPAYSAKAAQLLLDRGIAGIAIDTLSPDCQDDSFTVHQLMLGNGKYIIENIADCSLIPPMGAFIIALPLKLQNATEAPLRVIALVKK